MEIKKRYQSLAKRYKLPSFDSINDEFEISTIEEKAFLLREIRRKMTERIELYTKILNGLLQPEAVLSDMYECRIFTDEEKEGIFDVYKRLMFLNRLSIDTAIDEDDKRTSKFINDVWKEWPKLKKKFSGFVKKMKDGWLKETKIKEELRYLG